MKQAWFLAMSLAAPGLAAAQKPAVSLDDLVDAAEQWATNNLDDNALRLLQNIDRDRVNQLFADLQRQFQGEYVVNLAGLRDTSRLILPLLEQSDQSMPYAIWLKTRLDYLDTAEEFRLVIPRPKTAPGQPPQPIPNPPPQVERDTWKKKLADRPWPATARPYVARLKPIFAAQKVPSELVWIAEVESSFDPRARSPAGAAGLFQLMPATAKRYGVHVNPFDQRLNPEESARAAAQYLQFLHGHFKDWHLALAAYNAGEGTIQALLDRRKATTFDAIATRLPAETQMYVPKVEAVLFRREGLRLNQLQTPQE